MKPQHLLILGGTGFVGSHLLPCLVRDGHRITVLTRYRVAHRGLALLPGVRLIEADVYDAERLAHELHDIDSAINLVGILNERGRNGRGFQKAHVELTQTLIVACKKAGVKRLLQMSALNAGRGESFYLKTRGAAETAIKQSDLDWTIFRPSVIFGRGDGLFHRFADLLKITPVMPLARANARFAPVYVGDVCEAFARSLLTPESIGQVYELGGPQILSLREIVQYTALLIRRKRLVIGLPEVLGKLQGQVFDFVPGKPFSSDNYKSLLLDSVPEQDGLAALGIHPTPMQSIMPALLSGENKQARLDRYRKT